MRVVLAFLLICLVGCSKTIVHYHSCNCGTKWTIEDYQQYSTRPLIIEDTLTGYLNSYSESAYKEMYDNLTIISKDSFNRIQKH